MGVSFAAVGRSSGPRSREASSSRHAIYTSIADLVAMRAVARDFGPPPRHPVQGLLSAKRFHEDEPSATEWSRPQGSNRLGRGEDGAAEQPALIIVDQRLDMFFGSRRSMKSVAAAEAAALCAWRVLDHGDPVGGIVFNNSITEIVPPEAENPAVLRLIEAIASQNAGLRADLTQARAPTQLDAALKAARDLAARDPLQRHFIVVISDFRGHGPRTRELLIRLAARNDVLAVLVYDPFLPELPKAGAIVYAGGELQVDLDFGGGRLRRSLFEFGEAPGREILAFEREIGVPVLALSAAEETAPQLRRLLDRAPWQVSA